MINTAAYSFVSTAYPDNIEGLVSVIESVAGLGVTMGPVLGTFVYQAVGFSATFWIFGGAMTPISFLILILLPSPVQVKEGTASD